jgi:hypothetical protein
MPEYRQYETPGGKGVAQVQQKPLHLAAVSESDIK